MAEKRTTIMIDDNVFKKLKIHCAETGTSIKEFITDAINEKLNK